MNAVVEIARNWLGTPYVHQASCRGAGADCLGLVRGVWRDLFDEEPEVPPAYSKDWSEPQHQELLWEAAKRHLEPKPGRAFAPGDVLLFRMRAGSVAKHVGIVGEGQPNPTFIHSYSGHGVVESALSEAWRARLVAVFQFPARGR